MAEAFDKIYYQGFEQLLSCSNEKEIYRRKFDQYIKEFYASSVLDIGAGSGDVAIPISRQADRYLAVEQNPDYARALEEAGVAVIPRRFPTGISGRYDLVIMSHIISHTSGNHGELLPPAWELVAPGGHLLVVTHRTEDEHDDWSRLLDSVGLGYSESFQANVHDLVRDVRGRGVTESETATSTLQSPDLSVILGAMAFRASNGEPERHRSFMSKIDDITRLLEEQYRTEDGFSFPFLHLFLSAHKAVA